uniref:Uncharacterized protein n=1 Tax=Chromera velia CCMP2878 TaxID=1169474 RepID=A0A0G4F0P5_9ALVE|eukprot:Cvel_14364.t1-p1 / transcript=Cvel_14364.t1 / gene=Cvel_14364 / organism=Chromera_velia_CCMP2878 / gene_product=hypothetical protein / transcript_product=hypothetical protein / location=Cvel_scaffold1019:27139-27630(+) / protein_length=164 / sequence_SO=supercontig / SO=protein_coding / is_pseudo=false
MNNKRLGEKRKAVMEEEVSKIKKQKQQPAPPSVASSSFSSEQPSSSSKDVPVGEEASPLFFPQASPLASILSPLLTLYMDWMAKNPEGTKTVASFLGTVLSLLLPQAGAPELAPLPESQRAATAQGSASAFSSLMGSTLNTMSGVQAQEESQAEEEEDKGAILL